MSDQLSADLASLRIARNAPPPRGKALTYVVVLAAIAGAAVAVRLWAMPYAESKLFKPEVAVTEIGMVSPAQAAVDLTATGYVVPQVVAKVGAKVSGRVTKVSIQEGQAVKAGQVLFQLDVADQRSAIATAQAKVAAARSRAAAAHAKAQVARANVAENKVQLDRKEKLVATGAEPQASVDDLKAHDKALAEQVVAADVDAQAADADANAAQADVSALNVQLGNMTIVAPIDGTAVTKPSAIGDVVGPEATLVELADFNTLLIEVDVPEGRLGMAKKGAPCEVVLDSAPDKRLRGEVVEVSPRLNRAKASATVKVRIVDPVERMLPEMSARVSLLQKALDAEAMKEPPKKVIPAAAVVDRAGAKVTFVVDGGKVRMVPIVVGAPVGGSFELKDGPGAGTRVIKDPPPTLADGEAVKEKGGEG